MRGVGDVGLRLREREMDDDLDVAVCRYLLAASATSLLSKGGLGPEPTVRCGRDTVGEVCDHDMLSKSI